MSYTTQMDAARQGIITPEMKAVAASEHIAEDELRELIALGQVIIPANKNHKCLKPNGIGSRLRTKINVNLGTSRDWTDLDMEVNGKSKKCGRHGCRSNHGLELLRRYTEIPPQADE